MERDPIRKTMNSTDNIVEGLILLKAKVDSIHNRLLDVETDLDSSTLLELTHLTPADDLKAVKTKINQLINFINGSKNRDTRIFGR